MTKSRRRWVWRLMVVTMLVLPGVFSLLPAVSGHTIGDRADSWARGQRGADFTVDDLSVYPIAYRKAVYKSLAADEKAGLWRSQLDTLLLSGILLSDAQAAFVTRARAALSPAMFDAVIDAGAREELGRLCAEATVVLTREQARVFGNLGELGRPGILARASGSRVQRDRVCREVVEQMAGRAGWRQGGP